MVASDVYARLDLEDRLARGSLWRPMIERGQSPYPQHVVFLEAFVEGVAYDYPSKQTGITYWITIGYMPIGSEQPKKFRYCEIMADAYQEGLAEDYFLSFWMREWSRIDEPKR